MCKYMSTPPPPPKKILVSNQKALNFSYTPHPLCGPIMHALHWAPSSTITLHVMPGLYSFVGANFYFQFPYFQKLLKLMPTLEEQKKIAKEKKANHSIPLAPAEDFFSALISVHELDASLKLLRFNSVIQCVEEVCACQRSMTGC